MSGCNFRSDFIAAVCSSQKHRFSCTSEPASTNSSNPDTHCQLIQRGDQSEAPFQHTLRGRVGKQSTVCIICTGYFFKRFCFSSAWHFMDGFHYTRNKVTGQHWHWPLWISLILSCHGLLLRYIAALWNNEVLYSSVYDKLKLHPLSRATWIIDPFISYPSSLCYLITVLYFLE